MTPIGILIGLTRLRLLLILAGLAFFAGVQVPVGSRVLIGLLALVAVVFDGYLDEQRIAHSTRTTTVPPQRTHT